MKCSACSHDLEAGAMYCGNCGHPVPSAQPPTGVTAQPAVDNLVSSQATGSAPPSNPAAPTPVAVVPPQNTPLGAPTTPAVSDMQPPPAPQSTLPQAAPLPAYSTPPQPKPGGGKAVASFVLGIIGLLGWLVPIVGLAMGILALVLGLKSTRSNHRKLAITGIVLSIPVIILSLLAWVYNVQNA